MSELTREGELQKHGKILQDPAREVNENKALLTRIEPARGTSSPGFLPWTLHCHLGFSSPHPSAASGF